jgi:hypothetical protein
MSNDAQQTIEINRQKNQIDALIQTEAELREEIRLQNQRIVELESRMEEHEQCTEGMDNIIGRTIDHELQKRFEPIRDEFYKLMSNDALIQTEAKLLEEIRLQNQRMKEMELNMERMWETFGHAEIVFTTGDINNCNGTDRKLSWSYPISSKTVNICRIGDYDVNMLAKLQYFYQLEELILYNFNYEQSISILSSYYDSNSNLKTLKTLTLSHYEQGVKNEIQFYCKRKGIELIIA